MSMRGGRPSPQSAPQWGERGYEPAARLQGSQERSDGRALALSRRSFLKATGALVVSFSILDPRRLLGTAAAQAQDLSAAQLDSWLAIAQDGTVTLFTGKSELGTGIETALAQIAAEELDVAFEQMRVVQGDTALTVNQGSTVASITIAGAGNQIRQAAAEARQALLQLAAARLGVAAEQLTVRDSIVSVLGDAARSVAYAELVGGRRFELEVSGTATPKRPEQYTIVGQSIPRMDIPAKVTGQFRYVQDVRLPGMLHARVVRPTPQSGSRVLAVDAGSVAGLPGVVRVVVREGWVGVVAEREEQAVRAAQRLVVSWSDPVPLPRMDDLYPVVRATATTSDDVLADTGDVEAALAAAPHRRSATYEFPFQAHGMIGPDCAVADVRDGQATIWSGTQWVHGLRGQLVPYLGLPAERIRVIYVEGSGCYGRYAADDAALDAALLSQEVGRPVRVQWTRQEEHGWDHYNPAMVFDLRGGVDAGGALVAWDYAVWTAPHAYMGLQPLLGDDTGGPAWSRGGAITGHHTPSFYDVPHRRLVLHGQNTALLRNGNVRSLGNMPATFAAESFMDELAAAAAVDPIGFRRRALSDARASEVLRTVAEASGWPARPSPQRSTGTTGVVAGRGVALSLYTINPNFGRTWVATVAEVEVDLASGRVRVPRLVVAHDCGLIVNPDGVRNQIEGNVIQSTSRALYEEVTFDEHGVTSLDWSSYPILTFPDVPRVDIALINRPDVPSSGAGEPATAPTAAAIGNAIFDATGARLRRVPFTPSRVQAALRARGSS